MKRTRRPQTFSRGIGRVLALSTLPLVALLIVSNIYSIGYSNRLTTNSQRQMVEQMVGQIDSDLEMIERSITSLAFSEPEFGTMGHGESKLSVHLASHVISQRFSTMTNAFPLIGGLFMYSASDQAYVERIAEGDYSYSFRQSMRSLIREQQDWKQESGKWRVQAVGERYMLMYALRRDDSYMAVLADPQRLMTAKEDVWRVTYTDENGVALMPGSGLNLEKVGEQDCSEQSVYVEDGAGARYLAVWNRLNRAPVKLVLTVSGAGYWKRLTPAQIVMLALSLITVFIVPLSRRWVNRAFLRPLDELSGAMEQIRGGDLSHPIDHEYPTVELDQVRATFNNMISQIRTLRIEAYERELDRQRVEMQCMHMQLRPHFFLNCLKNIYASAEGGKYDQVKEMTLNIADYIRYLFRDNLKMVTLREEVNYVRNYIRIQQLSHTLPPICEYSVPEELMEQPVLPLFMETFVENAVKHQWRPDRQLYIQVRAAVLTTEEGRLLDITVTDNGDGFTPEVLERINALPSDSYYGEEHVGLSNLKHRLRLAYGEKAVMAFYNGEKGAVCEVICPLAEGKV